MVQPPKLWMDHEQEHCHTSFEWKFGNYLIDFGSEDESVGSGMDPLNYCSRKLLAYATIADQDMHHSLDDRCIKRHQMPVLLSIHVKKIVWK